MGTHSPSQQGWWGEQRAPSRLALMLFEVTIHFAVAQVPTAWSILVAGVTQHREKHLLCGTSPGMQGEFFQM